MSTHKVEVVRIREINKHPNADRMELVQVYGYTCCVRKGQFKVGDLAVYIEPDYVVPTAHPAFAFLEGKGRVRTRRFRGIWSQGLLMPLSDFPEVNAIACEGDCVMGAVGITRYEPPEPGEHRQHGQSNVGGGGSEKQPASFGVFSKYELENYRRYADTMPTDAELVATEKIHGCNARYRWANGRLYAASRTQWKANVTKRDAVASVLLFLRAFLESLCPSLRFLFPPTPHGSQNVWWQAVEQNPWIEAFCKTNPHLELHGEVYGWVQDIRYGAKDGQVFFRAFDIRDTLTDEWLSYDEFAKLLDHKQRVPQRGWYTTKAERQDYVDDATEFAEHANIIGSCSQLYDGPGEGVVIKDSRRRKCSERVALKFVSDQYLEK